GGPATGGRLDRLTAADAGSPRGILGCPVRVESLRQRRPRKLLRERCTERLDAEPDAIRRSVGRVSTRSRTRSAAEPTRSDLACHRPAGLHPREDAPAEERTLERVVPVDAATSEAGDLARRVQARERLAVGVEALRVERGLQAPEGLAGHQMDLDRDERPPGAGGRARARPGVL